VPMLLLLAAASVLSLQATEVRRVPAKDAEQGVASDGKVIYAINNHAIARIDANSGKEINRWDGDPEQFKHINSCVVDDGKLLCSASNFPNVPMQSYIERFDATSLQYLGRQTIEHGYGSLTWSMRHDGSWWACFANYDKHGGEPGRDHRYTTLVRYDAQWHEQAQWRFPDDVLDRMAPMSASGGAWGKDGLLYVNGHDKPELYAFRVPEGGGVLEHVATIATPTGGQAIGWDAKASRQLWTIDRAKTEVVASRIPAVSGQ
jgi:outer membrane protein assembly factor BamB